MVGLDRGEPIYNFNSEGTDFSNLVEPNGKLSVAIRQNTQAAQVKISYNYSCNFFITKSKFTIGIEQEFIIYKSNNEELPERCKDTYQCLQVAIFNLQDHLELKARECGFKPFAIKYPTYQEFLPQKNND